MGSARSRVVSCAAVAAILLSAPVATIADTEYRFKGNDDAIKVCRSIINDNVAQLRFALKRSNLSPHEQTYENYRCNGMVLAEFAFTQNSARTGEYLETRYGEQEGNIFIEQVGSIEVEE